MANEAHFKILNQGVDAWNMWRKENPEIQPDLRRVLFFRGADLQGINFSMTALANAHFRQAHLRGANLSRANLWETNFRGADLREVDLSAAYIRETNLWTANLSGANLREADFYWTGLIETDLSRVTMCWTRFTSVYFHDVKGLDTVKHQGPSYIDVHTIYRSKGNLPEVFLKGAGVPDSMIEFMYSLVRSEKALDFYSCFISYSSRDQAFAERLHADLQDKGVRCWFAPEDMKIGDKIRPTLDQSIRVHDKLLLILSEHSVASDWVEQEVETALDRERQEKRTVLFPIRLDNTVMEIDAGWPALIRNTRHIGDFRNWKDHDAYQQAFGRLLRDLKAEGDQEKINDRS